MDRGISLVYKLNCLGIRGLLYIPVGSLEDFRCNLLNRSKKVNLRCCGIENLLRKAMECMGLLQLVGRVLKVVLNK